MIFSEGDTIYSDDGVTFGEGTLEEALEMAWDSADFDETDIVIWAGTVVELDRDDSDYDEDHFLEVLDIRELHYEKLKASEYFNEDDFRIKKLVGSNTTGDMK